MDLKGFFEGEIDRNRDVEVDVDIDRHFGCLQEVSKSGPAAGPVVWSQIPNIAVVSYT